MACTEKVLPQVLVAVKDPDTIIHGAHEFKREMRGLGVEGKVVMEVDA